MSFQAIACDAAVKLLDEFLFGDHGVEKLVAVDDYNALYWKTQYFYWKSDVHKVMIPVENITLVHLPVFQTPHLTPLLYFSCLGECISNPRASGSSTVSDPCGSDTIKRHLVLDLDPEARASQLFHHSAIHRGKPFDRAIFGAQVSSRTKCTVLCTITGSAI